jgi:hypothetical protein
MVPGGVGVTEFRLLCTDRGQHRTYALARILVGRTLSDFVVLSDSDKSFRPAGRVSFLGDSPRYDEFRCAGCGRNPRIDHEKLVRSVRELCRLGRTELDISQLGF